MGLTNFAKVCYNHPMSTINISLPEEQVTFIDSLVHRFRFANRSELVRSLLRLARAKPAILSDAATFPFTATPPNQSAGEVLTDFKKTKRYSPAFLKDLEEGLKESKYFST